jgi:hypothetical protein
MIRHKLYGEYEGRKSEREGCGVFIEDALSMFMPYITIITIELMLPFMCYVPWVGPVGRMACFESYTCGYYYRMGRTM